MKKHVEIRIYGKVQKVFFRSSAAKKAHELILTGLAENLPDGSVHIEAEGEEERLKELLKWCWTGSFRAEVQRVSFNFSDGLKDFKDFSTI